MKRYLVFGYDNYYPSGGWYDLQSQTDSLGEAKSMAKAISDKGLLSHVIDTQTGDGEEVDWRA